MRAGSALLSMALGCAALASAVPREEFFGIDRPIWLGLDRITARLQSVRASRPVVALHLSGGSARGLAHLGVLKRLEEAGFTPDLIVTTSAGSVVGLMYAAGIPPDVIADIFATVDFAGLFTAKLPTGAGIADLRGLLALTRELVGEADIAALPTPVVAVCEDLRSMRRVLLAEGELGTVLQAAITIPALFEPVEWRGLVLIDGGISNLAPMEPFREIADVHIASTAFYDLSVEPNDPFTAFTMAVNIPKSRAAVRDIDSVQPFVIRSDVESLPYMAWHRLPEVFARGYEACSQRLPELERYLAERKSSLSVGPSPQRERAAALLRERWAAIKRRLAAGQRIRPDRGSGALQLHPLLLKLYRAPNRLEQSNYAALSYLYDGSAGGLRVGALSDIEDRHGAFLDLEAASRCGLRASLRNFFFTDDQSFYHLLRSDWPVPLGDRLAVDPFVLGELLWAPPWDDPQARAAAGVASRLAGRAAPDSIGVEVALFLQTPRVFGMDTELLVRRRLAGPFHARARGLLRQSWPAVDALEPSYNDFFRGADRDEALDSYAVFNAELVLAPERLFFTIWEAVIFRKLELAVFCDVLWEEAARLSGRLHPSVGASLRGDAALGGLLPLSAMLSFGYDLDAERPVLTLNLGAPY